MQLNLKSFLQLALSLLLAGALLYYVFSIVNFNTMVEEFSKANIFWIFVSMLVSVVSLIARGLRWNILLEPLDLKIKPINGVKSVSFGYLANYIFPRFGEVARCTFVNRTDNIPLDKAIGTVITERIVDVVATLIIIALSFVLEFEKLFDFINGLVDFSSLFQKANMLVLIFVILITCLFLVVYIFKKYKDKILSISIVAKIIGFVMGLMTGITSILKMKKVSLFLFYSFLIWLGYYAMVYFILFSMDDTAYLPSKVGVIVLCLGSLGMIAPVQGGFGAYHIMVASALMLYGISQEKGLIMATIMHTSQFILMIIAGGISAISLILTKKKVEN